MMTSKERAKLKGSAMTLNTVINIGKNGITPELAESVNEVLEARELVKLGILKNCPEDSRSLAMILSERTRSEVVQVIGKKIVLYKKSKKRRMEVNGNENRNHGGNI